MIDKDDTGKDIVVEINSDSIDLDVSIPPMLPPSKNQHINFSGSMILVDQQR